MIDYISKELQQQEIDPTITERRNILRVIANLVIEGGDKMFEITQYVLSKKYMKYVCFGSHIEVILFQSTSITFILS